MIPSFPLSVRRVLAAFLGVLLVATGFAAKRSLRIEAAPVVRPDLAASIVVIAETDDEGNERVAFLQVEASRDGGKTWTALCYLTDGAKREAPQLSVKAGAAGSQILVRARAAFRSKAGDVDYQGKPVDWAGTWETWAEPPARKLRVSVR